MGNELYASTAASTGTSRRERRSPERAGQGKHFFNSKKGTASRRTGENTEPSRPPKRRAKRMDRTRGRTGQEEGEGQDRTRGRRRVRRRARARGRRARRRRRVRKKSTLTYLNPYTSCR